MPQHDPAWLHHRAALRATRRHAVAGLGGALALLVAGNRPLAVAARSATPGPTAPITDDVLGSGLPAAAPGNVLQLERVTLAPGAVIPPHVHPGAYVIAVE